MADGDIDQKQRAVEPLGGEVELVQSGGIIVLDGPQAAIERLVAGDPAFRTARRVQPSSTVAIGALETLMTLMGKHGGGATVFQLDPAGQALFNSGALTDAGDGFYRLFGQASDGKFIGHGALKPIAMGSQQLATAQLAMATVALTAAIKEVQKAVERVEDKVDLLRDILDAERDGEIIGANRALRRRAEHVGFDSTMSDADWHAIDDVGVEVEQQIERLRAFIRKRLAAAEDEGRKLSGRLDAVEHANDVAETLALLIVAQDSLFLFQQLRILRIRATQPEFSPAAIEEARALLNEHAAEDADLIQRLRALVEERVKVEALEVLHFRAATEIARLAPKVNETLAWFAEQRGLSYESFAAPPLPGAAEVVDEVKDRGAALASDGRRAIGELTGKIRTWKGSRRDEQPELEPGDVAAALPAASGDVAKTDREGTAGRFSKLRSSALARVRELGSDDAPKESGVESDPDLEDEA